MTDRATFAEQACERFGFQQVGFLSQVGYKFGHWTDTVMVQRSLGLGATAPPET